MTLHQNWKFRKKCTTHTAIKMVRLSELFSGLVCVALGFTLSQYIGASGLAMQRDCDCSRRSIGSSDDSATVTRLRESVRFFSLVPCVNPSGPLGTREPSNPLYPEMCTDPKFSKTAHKAKCRIHVAAAYTSPAEVHIIEPKVVLKIKFVDERSNFRPIGNRLDDRHLNI